MATWAVDHRDARTWLASLPTASARCCVTSPPYWGLRDYGVADQIGLEPTPAAYVAALVDVFRAVRGVLTDDGTVWLNLGDSYAGSPNSGGTNQNDGGPAVRVVGLASKRAPGLKAKDLVGIPWAVAFALRDDGWYLRADIIWSKPNPMPESITDRPTKAHEYIFLLAKSARYYYDADAIAELSIDPESLNGRNPRNPDAFTQSDPNGKARTRAGFANLESGKQYPTRNKRSVWYIPTQSYDGAHFATFPEDLITPCIRAGSAVGDTVIDPFTGSGTTGVVAIRHGRHFAGCDVNADYVDLARTRIGGTAPLFAQERPAAEPINGDLFEGGELA